jgi:D-alanyl-D-alanine carboxypeptidase
MRILGITLLLISSIAGTLAAEPPPALMAKSVMVLDERSGKILYTKNADTKRFPASTTKIMTALLLLEHCAPDEIITAPRDVENVPPSSLHLKPGEQLTAQDMLYALMIRSANDAAYAVAIHIGGSVKNFAKMMNDRAKMIGCKNTVFNNPHGLNDPKHVSTARDLALIAKEAMKNPAFREAANTRKRFIARSINQEDLWLSTKNKVLKHDPSADGIKTGYTRPAGYCFVGSATRNGARFITVILGSKKDWHTDQSALMNWAHRNFVRSRLESPGEVERPVPLLEGEKDAVRSVLREPVFYAHDRSAPPGVMVEIQPKPGLIAPVAEGMEIGTAIFRDSAGWKFETPLYAAETVDMARPLASLASPGPAGVMFLGVLGGSALLMRRRTRASI